MKKLISVILVCMLLFSLSAPALAVVDTEDVGDVWHAGFSGFDLRIPDEYRNAKGFIDFVDLGDMSSPGAGIVIANILYFAIPEEEVLGLRAERAEALDQGNMDRVNEIDLRLGRHQQRLLTVYGISAERGQEEVARWIRSEYANLYAGPYASDPEDNSPARILEDLSGTIMLTDLGEKDGFRYYAYSLTEEQQRAVCDPELIGQEYLDELCVLTEQPELVRDNITLTGDVHLQGEAEPVNAPEPTDDWDSSVPAESAIPYWAPDSRVMASIVQYIDSVTDEFYDTYIPPEDRIAVFDFDGTLYGELFPTYFDVCLLIHRVLHDDSFEAPADVKEYVTALEEAVLNHQPEPESPRSTAQIAAECFAGMTLEEYRAYVRDFMQTPAVGFVGMNYAQGYYLPMVALVQVLVEHDFKVFISSGSERSIVRELITGTLDEWVPSERVIGSTFSLVASGQGDKNGRSYTYGPDDQILMEGNLTVKNQKTNKVFSIINEIGKAPILVFGNSSGDLAMGQYAVQHGGKGYMLLCDDTDRDYGNPAIAESFAVDCAAIGLETVSMKNDFATIYMPNVQKVGTAVRQDVLQPAA